MLPKEIDENSFKDVFKTNVQDLLNDKDKRWWLNFKDDQEIIHPTESKVNDYDDIWDVEEGEREIPRSNDMITVRSKKLKPITITDHPVIIGDLEVDDIVIFDKERRYLGDIIDIDEEDNITILKRRKAKDDTWIRSDETKKSNKSKFKNYYNFILKSFNNYFRKLYSR